MNLVEKKQSETLKALSQAHEKFSKLYPRIIDYRSLSKAELENLMEEIDQIRELVTGSDSYLLSVDLLMTTLYFSMSLKHTKTILESQWILK